MFNFQPCGLVPNLPILPDNHIPRSVKPHILAFGQEVFIGVVEDKVPLCAQFVQGIQML